MKAGYTHNLCVDTHHDLCLLCASLCVPLRDFSLIKTDGVDNACVPVLPSGFEKENILMFARRGDTIGGDIVTGDWSDNGKWDSAVDIRCKVAPNVQRGNVHAAAIHHNVPSGVVDGDSGGGNLPPPICKPVSNLRCSISQCQSHLVSIIGLLCFGKAKPPIFHFASVDQWPMPLSDEGYFPHPIHQLRQQLAMEAQFIPKLKVIFTPTLALLCQ